MRCEYARDDGAYVLGALAPAERAAFQRHLAGCRGCREAVAELAVLPGLLGRLATATAEQVAEAATAVEASRLPTLLAAAQVERRRGKVRRRWRMLAAAAAVLMAFAVGVFLESDVANPRTGTTELASMVAVDHHGPVTAEVGFTETLGGTRITVHCWYLPTGDYHKPWTFRLYAVATDGVSEQVASWSAAPGEELRFDTLTRFVEAELAKVELRLGDGTPLLVYTMP